MVYRTSSFFVKDYLAAKITLEFDRSVVHVLHWVYHKWHLKKVHFIQVHEYVYSEITKMFPSFMRMLWFSFPLGALLVLTRRRRIAPIDDDRNVLLLVRNVLLSHLRNKFRAMSMLLTSTLTVNSMYTLVAPIHLVFGRISIIGLTATFTFSKKEARS